MTEAPARTERFASLDALRGIAAICVMLYHAEPNSPVTAPWGYLAVDLFFCLSGFVIALSYEDRLRAGMSLGQFTRRRLIRLYPMAYVAALVGLALWGGNPAMLLLLPDFASGGALFPTNPPMWSLLLELLANVAFAAVVFAAPTGRLVAVTAACGVLFAGAIIGVGTARQMGPEWSLVLPGLVRTGFSFGMGVLLFRLWRARAQRRTTHLAWMLLLALPVLLVVPRIERVTLDLAAVFVVIPLIVWLGASWELPARKLAGWLGDLSYPLYCINMPILAYMGGERTERTLLCAALVVGALGLDRLVDRPGQRLLKRLLLRPAPAVPATLPSGS